MQLKNSLLVFVMDWYVLVVVRYMIKMIVCNEAVSQYMGLFMITGRLGSLQHVLIYLN